MGSEDLKSEIEQEQGDGRRTKRMPTVRKQNLSFVKNKE
jgi:hypothetical protein